MTTVLAALFIAVFSVCGALLFGAIAHRGDHDSDEQLN